MMVNNNLIRNIKPRFFRLVDLIQGVDRKILPISVRGLLLAIATGVLIISCNSASLKLLRVSVGVWLLYEPF